MDARYFFAIMGNSIFKGCFNDAFACFTGNDFDGVDRIIIDFIFYADIEVFCIFTERHEVDVREGSFYGDVRFCRADISI